MGQDEVLDFIKLHKNKWLRTRDIIKGVKLSPTSVARSLKGLYIRGYLLKRTIKDRIFEYQLRVGEK